MTNPLDDVSDEFVAVARQAMRAGGGVAALDALDWFELLAQLDDPTVRLAVFALFRAQGHELASSPALGALVAFPYATQLGLDPTDLVAAVPHGRHGATLVVVGDVTGRTVLVERPGTGVTLHDAASLDLRALDVPGRLAVARIEGELPRAEVVADEAAVADTRHRATRLGRIAIATEIAGAAEGALELAVAYAGMREQFGSPIGRFQAVRHLLAWAAADSTSLSAVARLALDDAAPAAPRLEDVAKAIAGRNGRRVCERTLQVLGGIGFTAEHDHHHLHSRVLLLDSLLGSSAELTPQLGAWLRDTGGTDAFTELALTSTGASGSSAASAAATAGTVGGW